MSIDHDRPPSLPLTVIARRPRLVMVEQRILPNPKNERTEDLYERELLRLKEQRALEAQLNAIDSIKSFRRIYVMGCGRSGTWLLTNLMSTFKDTEVVPRELGFEYFGLLVTNCSVLVLKRDHTAYQRVEEIPENIKIAYIIRHPFDVLTSHLPISQRPYHILPHRWLGEMLALQYLLDTERKHTKVIRYEDLVGKPLESQATLGSFFDLRVGISIDDFYTVSNNPTEAPAATRGARKIDMHSINKHKRDPQKLKYLNKIRPRLGRMLEWVGQVYKYDVSL
jgi:hypothetical protein